MKRAIKLLVIVILWCSGFRKTNAQVGTWANSGFSFPSAILALAEFNGAIEAGGVNSTPEEIRALAVYNGALYKTGLNIGAPTNVFKNGISIGAINGGVPLRAMAVFNNELYVGGSFSTINGVMANSIARWNGSAWSAVAGGINGAGEEVHSLGVYNGDLYAGTNTGMVYKWNGLSWSSTGSFTTSLGIGAIIRCFGVYNGSLYAGGFFESVNGVSAVNLAKYDGFSWSSVGDIGIAGDPNYGVSTLATYNSELYCGGSFGVAGGITATNIARYNSFGWQSVGNGTNGAVYALAVSNNQLYVGGSFTSAGGIIVNNIAKWFFCTPPAASITYQGSNTVCNPGGNLLLTANSGSGLTYQWKQGNSLIAGATTSTYLVGSAGGIFSVIVSNSSGCSTTSAQVPINTTTIFANASPSGPLSICSGSSVLLTAYVNTGYTYQWKKNGLAIAGATSSTYNVTSVGNYSVDESYGACTKTSNSVVVNIGSLTAALSPSGPVSICAGTTLTMNATTGSGYTYNWYRNNVLLSATTSTYSTTSGGTYKCVVTSGTCSATTNSVVVTQITNPTPTVTYSSPLSFCSPGSVTFTANTFAGVTYQWENNSVPIAGATLQNYTATGPGLYRCNETANGCSRYTSKVSVSSAPSAAAAISTNDPTTLCSGGTVNMTVSNPIPGYSYQWKKNTININGATATSYVASSTGSYTVLATASCGTTTSNAIAVSIGSFAAQVTPSGNVTLCTGGSLLLTANTGTGFTYQWKKNNVNIAGATAATYSVTTAGSYTVAMTSPCGNGTSAATVVTQNTVTASLTPAGTTTVCSGTTQTYTANTGTGYTYRWYRNNVLLSAITPAYTTTSAGSYRVEVSINGSCAVLSNTGVLAVINNPTPVLTASGPTTFCSGQSVTFTANTFAGVTYQWQKNSVNIGGATSQSYTVTTAGTYRVNETANGCSKFTPKNAVTVNCRVGGETSEEVQKQTSIEISPNPFAEKLNIEITSPVTEQIEVKVMDVLGKVQYSQLITTNTATALNLQFPAGIYMVAATVDGKMKTVRVVKTK